MIRTCNKSQMITKLDNIKHTVSSIYCRVSAIMDPSPPATLYMYVRWKPVWRQWMLLTLAWLADAMQARRTSRGTFAVSIGWSRICVHQRIHALTQAVCRRSLNYLLLPHRLQTLIVYNPSCGLFVQHSLCNVLHNCWVSLTTYH